MICRKVKMLAATTVAVVVLAAGAWAQESWTSGSTTVTLDNGTLTVSGTGAMANYTSGTGMPWNSVKSSITGVVIGEGVTNVGDRAFHSCTGLTSVMIPSSVTSIGVGAFTSCSGLTSVTIPDGVTSIGISAFQDCFNLTSVTIGSGVTSIASYAFQNCTNLTSVTIPNSVTAIGSNAFQNCTGLTSVTIPNSVTSIGGAAFYGCTGLTSITCLAEIPPTLGTNALPTSACVYVTEESIDAYFAAAGWNSRTCFYANDVRVTKWVSGSTTVTLNNGTLTVSGTGAMANYSSGAGIPWNGLESSITKVVIENGVTNIGNYAFYECTGLTSVTIPDGVTSIGIYAFSRCRGLPSVTIPNSVTSIGNYAFSNCTGLTSVTIPESVTSIGNYAFQYCTGLTSVTIPESVTSIGNNAFQYCAGLTSVTIPSSVTSIGNYAFQYCTGLTSVTSLKVVPPTIYSGYFSDVTVASATLYVPDAAVNAYSAAAVWQGFGTILGTTIVTVTFDPQGGSGAAASQTIHYNGKVTEPADPTLAGFYFDGWFKETECTTEWDFGVDVVTAAVTLYAKWTTIPEHAVHFDPQGGNAVSSEYVQEGQKATTPTAPILAGHTFGGWYKEPDCINAWDFGTEITETVTLYAKWTINTYAVTFSAGENGSLAVTVDGSEITTGALVQYGKSVVFTATPADGYDVIGWTVNGVAVADNATDTYTLTSVSAEATVAVSFGKTNSIVSSNRVIPQTKPKEEATVIAPVTALSGEFTAGPNPVSKQSGIVNFFRQGKRVSNSELRIYDATGNVINSVKISDKALNSQARRQVGSWDLKDKSGRTVSEGTYLVKGVIKTSDGKSEKVSVILSVR